MMFMTHKEEALRYLCEIQGWESGREEVRKEKDGRERSTEDMILVIIFLCFGRFRKRKECVIRVLFYLGIIKKRKRKFH